MATNSGWWMYHGDPAHTGFVGSGSAINAAALSGGKFGILHTLNVGGSILSVPAVTGGFIYVGLANSRAVVGELGGTLLKIELASGSIAHKYTWSIKDEFERDAHGFCGMGSTPSVVGDDKTGKVYFVGFNAKLYCLNAGDLSLVWVTDLRNADLAHNQPIQTYNPGTDINNEPPPAAGWSAPLVVNGRIYLGIGEGENPTLNSFVFCLDAASGNVVWVFCTNQYFTGKPNLPNQLPANVLTGPPPSGFTVVQPSAATPTQPSCPLTLGCSVWGCIAYDAKLNRLYCPTGNGVPDLGLGQTPGWANGLLSLDATTGVFKAFYGMPPESNYRDSDIDVDVGASPTLFDLGSRRVVGVGCKNGSFHVLDADTLASIKWRQLLPTYNDGTQIPTVDPHPSPAQANASVQNPRIANRQSDADQAENYSGIYSTAAVHPPSRKIFVGIGGNNYHSVAAGIDTPNTPFMRALDYDTLADAWPVDNGNPPRYTKARPPLYTNSSESGLSSPAVVNDVVFMATTYVSLYAFSVADGTKLFEDRLGEQTGGFNGGYGYCMGPAVCGNYVVAGALVFGGDGGVLRIYGITGAVGSV
jgi:outer membrane protein assembly factor BamB